MNVSYSSDCPKYLMKQGRHIDICCHLIPVEYLLIVWATSTEQGDSPPPRESGSCCRWVFVMTGRLVCVRGKKYFPPQLPNICDLKTMSLVDAKNNISLNTLFYPLSQRTLHHSYPTHPSVNACLSLEGFKGLNSLWSPTSLLGEKKIFFKKSENSITQTQTCCCRSYASLWRTDVVLAHMNSMLRFAK